MTLSVTHSYVSSVGETTPSGGPGGTVGPTEWNANHTLTGVVSPAQGGTGITSGLGVTYFSSGTVIADSGTLSTNQLVVGGGPNGAPATIGSLGTTSQVLHGNASGNPSFGAVNLASEVAGTLSTGNLQTATTAVFGIVKPDNSTVTISSGVISASIAIGGSSGQVQYNAGGSALGGIANTNTDGANFTSIRISTTASLDWQSSSTSSGVAVSLFQEGQFTLAQRNTTNPEIFRVYNTFTDVNNYERGVMDWAVNGNILTIGSQNAGSGSQRDVQLVAGTNAAIVQILHSDGSVWLRTQATGSRIIMGSSNDLGISEIAAGVLEINRGTQGNHDGWLNWGGEGRVTANVTSTSTSLANITGLTATLSNGRNYSFSCEVIGTCSSSGGIQLALNTTSTSTGYTLLIDGYAVDAGNLIRGYSQQTAVGTAVIASTITNTSFHASLWGTITTSSSMVVNFQIAQQNLSATQTIAQRGSHSFFHDMP